MLEVNVTYCNNPWEKRKEIAADIQRQLANLLGAEVNVCVSCAEMQHGVIDIPERYGPSEMQIKREVEKSLANEKTKEGT